MTNAKETGDTSAARELLSRKETGPGPHPPRALDHLAVAILAANGASVEEALSALQHLRRDFVDWNEVRVARIQEVARSLAGTPGAELSAKAIRDEYNSFFDKKGALNFEFLLNGKPAENRRALAQLLPRLSKGALSLLLYEFCLGAQMPLSDEGLRQAKRDGIVGKSGDRGQLARVLVESLPLRDAALLLQYWELETSGSPYGEPLKKDGGGKKGKKK